MNRRGIDLHAGDQADHVAHRRVRRDQVAGLPSVAHNEDAIGQLKHVRHVVADQHDGEAALLHPLDQVQHAARFPHAERRRRLVHDDDLAAPGDGARHRHALPLSAGEKPDRLAHRFKPDAQGCDVLRCFPPHRRLVQQPAIPPACAGDLAPEKEVRLHIHMRHDGQVLVHRLDPQRAGFKGRGDAHLPPLEPDQAGIGLQGAGHDLHQRRLPGTIVADQADDLPRVKLERHPIQRVDGAEPLVDADKLQDGLGARHVTCSRSALP